MATYYSGTFATGMTTINCRLELTVNSQNIAKNTSNVTVKAKFWRNNSWQGDTYGTGTCYVKINGTEYSQAITPSQSVKQAGIYLFSKTLDIPHNADGTKTLPLELRATHEMFPVDKKTWSPTLTTIPRASTFTLSSSNVNAGASTTLNITRASSSFTHKAYLVFGTKTWTIGTSIATSQAYTIPNETMNQIPNAVKGTGTIRVETYNGSTKLGEKTASIVINVPSSVVPSFSSLEITRVDNGVPSDWGIYVQSKSKATLSISGASGNYGSTITSYSISGGGYSSTASSFTTGVLNTSGTNTFTAKITDSRGRTATKTTTITVYEYAQPQITKTNFFRCNSNGTANEDGTYISATIDYNYSTVNSKNTHSCSIWFRKKGTTSWGSEIALTKNTAKVIGSGTISVDSTYELCFRAKDGFIAIDKYIDLPTGSTTVDFRAGGKGVAIGKVSEKDAFEVGMVSEFSKTASFLGHVNMKSPILYHSSSTGAESSGYLKIARLVVKRSNINSPLCFTIGQRGKGVFSSFYFTPTNVSNNDPAVGTFYRVNGSVEAYVYKSTTSTFEFYVKKDGWNRADVVDFQATGHYRECDIIWLDELVSSLPSGYTACSNITGNFTDINGSGALNLTGAITTNGGVTSQRLTGRDSLLYLECIKDKGLVMGLNGETPHLSPYTGYHTNFDLGVSGSRHFRNLWLTSYNRSATGYTRLNNGMFLQWGKGTGFATGTSWSVTFPMAFPNAVFGMWCQGNWSNSNNYMYYLGALSKTGCIIYKRSTAGGSATDECFWMAIGM